jgi:Cdc6-like AAA superfamily ATPase
VHVFGRGDNPDAAQQREMDELLATMRMQSASEQTQLLHELAANDPVLAAKLSLRLNNPNAAAPDHPVVVSTGLPSRFAVARRLGQGAFGTVYEAWDQEGRRPVAVKVLRQAQPEALFRFKQEFRVLANLRHPNLIELYELFEHDQLWFFTMELVRGNSFLQYVRSPSGCDLVRLRRCVRDLARVLGWLHENEVLHRDIKPDNTIIDDSGRLVLLDFGLARHLAPSAQSGTLVVGTPAYMAPEQISEGSISYAADWYAVGGLIYHALTGKTPFEGSLLQILEAKACRDPVSPSTLATNIPPEWDDICRRLLDRSPLGRPTGPELLALFDEPDAIVPPRPSKTRTFVGREDVLDRMMACCQTAEDSGLPAVLEITGPSGFGKTSLVDAFAQSVASSHRRSLIIRGRCYEYESVPFKALDALLDDLSRQMQGLGDAVRDLLPADIAALTQLFPVLERVDAIRDVASERPVRISNEAEKRRRAFLCLVELLTALSTKWQVVLCLDDLQWGDADSAAFVRTLCAAPRIPALVLVATYRSDDAESEFVRVLRDQIGTASARLVRVKEEIGPLNAPDATELACILLRRQGVSVEDPAALAAECKGNPLLIEQFVAELARSMAARESMRPTSVSDLVRARLARLSSSAREIVAVLAAVGEPLAESVAIRLAVAGQDGSDEVHSSAISSLLSENLVRRKQSTGGRELDIQHDQIRTAIVESVPQAERRAMHVHIAEALVSIGYEDDGLIAVQFARGGDAPRAAQYSVKAARAAEAVLAFERAAQFISVALAVGAHQGSEAASLYERLARAYAASGRSREAVVAYEQAVGFADAAEWKFALRRHAAEECIRSGNVRKGVAMLEALGGEFGLRWTDNVAVAICSIAWSRIVLTARGLRYREHRAEELPARDVARLDACWAMTAGLSLWNPVIGARFQLRHLRLALRSGEPRRVAVALATEAAFRSIRGERAYAAARSLLAESTALGTRLDDAQIRGTAHAMGGMCGWLTGRWDEATDFGVEGERILREHCSGVSWELSIARNAALGGLLWSGEWRQYRDRLAEWTQDARQRGDVNSLSVYLMNKSPVDLALDDAEEAARDLDEAEQMLGEGWSRRGSHVPNFIGLFGKAQVAQYRGCAAAEFSEIDRRLRKFRRSLLLRIETLAVLSLLLEGSLCLAAAADPNATGGRAALLDRATRVAESLRRRRAVWTLGLATLIEAGAHAASGRDELACSRWSDAERELERSGMRMYAAAARYWRGRTAGDRDCVQAAESVIREQGVKAPARIAWMLAPGALHP